MNRKRALDKEKKEDSIKHAKDQRRGTAKTGWKDRRE
jgi:hypothetical protein